MSDHRSAPAPILQDSDQVSLLALGSVILRRRWLIIGLTTLGALISLTDALRSPRVYVSTATFIPQSSQPTSGLSLAASQFGITLPSSGGSVWGPATYVELLRSRELYEPMVRESLFVRPGENIRRTAIEMFNVQGPNAALKQDAAVQILRGMITPMEVKSIGGVRVKATSPWPAVSLAMANRVVSGVNDFNLRTRKSQAAEEVRFSSAQAADAERALRQAENRLQDYLQANRVITSPQLTMERDRLRMDVELKQELFVTYQKAREEARVREVRETPVITVFETPRLPLFPESRNVVLKALLGGIVGGTLALLFAFASHLSSRARHGATADAQQFFELLDQSKPRFLKRGSVRR
jgi:uncharacterized protein involved in exopolysaccharide biosynthesis